MGSPEFLFRFSHVGWVKRSAPIKNKHTTNDGSASLDPSYMTVQPGIVCSNYKVQVANLNPPEPSPDGD